MAENSAIEWTTHTFNPWIGCTKISPACDNCYAAVWDSRGLQGPQTRWGPHADRTLTKTWGNPVKWNKQAVAQIEQGLGRPRVFCASHSDVFDNHRSILPFWRARLWTLIRDTPNLDWLLLTKRPQNIAKMLPGDWGNGYPNVWLGTTTENQGEFDRRKPALVAIPAVVHFLSMEPLLGPVEMDLTDIEWVITGGESAKDFRAADDDLFRAIRDQCEAANVPFLYKQGSGVNQKAIKAQGRELDGVIHDCYPDVARSWADMEEAR